MVQYRLGGGAPAGYPQGYFGGGMAHGGPVMRRALPFDPSGQMVNGPGSGFGPGSVEDTPNYQGVPAWAHQPAYAGPQGWGGYPQMPGYPQGGAGGMDFYRPPPSAPMGMLPDGRVGHLPAQSAGGGIYTPNGQGEQEAPTMAYGGAKPAPSIQHPQVPMAHQVNPMVWDSLGPVGQELARGAIAQTGQDVGQYEYDMNRARPQGYAGQAPVNRYRPQQRSFSGF